jgi:hypothetical protein
VRRRAFRFGMAGVALAYVIDVFLPWVPRDVGPVSLPLSGIETSTAVWLSFFTGFALLGWELGFAVHGSRAAGADRIGAVLAGITAVLAISGILEARSTRIPVLHEDDSLAYGAWVALLLSGLLVMGALAQAALSIRASHVAQE